MAAPDDFKHRLTNFGLTMTLVGTMVMLLALCGFLLAGAPGALGAVCSVAVAMLFGVRSSGRLELWLSRARFVPRNTAPGLYRVLDVLSYHAKVNVPNLAWVPSPVVQAFTVGPPQDATIAVTDGLVRTLTDRELVAVLAHEMAHLRHNDLWVLAFADVTARLTRVLALVGWAALALSVPMAMVYEVPVPWQAVGLILVVPYLSSVLQLALSRSREYDADYLSAKITGDPLALASALEKIEGLPRPTWWRAISPVGVPPVPSIFRAHPRTADRIRRLKQMKQRPSVSQMHVGKRLPAKLTPSSKARERAGWAWVFGAAHGQRGGRRQAPS